MIQKSTSVFFWILKIKVISRTSFSRYFLAWIWDVKTLRRCSFNPKKLNFRNGFFEYSMKSSKVIISNVKFTVIQRLSSMIFLLILDTARNSLFFLFTFHSYEIRNKRRKKLKYLLMLSPRKPFTSHFSDVGKSNCYSFLLWGPRIGLIHFFASVGCLEARYI